MADTTQTTRFRFWLWLIRVIGVIVPRRLRADWRQEWEAELRYRERLLAEWDRLDWRNKLELLRRSASAFWDALVLQPQRWEDEMIQDLRYSVRMLAKNRVFTFVAILTLSFGIGANTSIFSVIHAVLLSPLPYSQSERMVALGVSGTNTGAEWALTAPLTAPEFVEIEKQNQLLEHPSTFDAREFILTGRGAPEQLKGQRISQGLLALFGVHPNPGRSFSAEEFEPGRDQVVLISHRLWQSRWGSDPNLIGQSVTLQRKSYTVIGIIPPGFNFFTETDVLVPWAFAEELSGPYAPYAHGYKTVARLKPGITIERAQRELSAILSRFEKSTEMRVYPLREVMARDFRPTLFMLWGVVGCVLLIACANFANLLLARGANRQKEIAIRMAIGARRFRIVRQLLVESALLALLGGAVGMLFAHWGIDALLAAGPVDIPQPLPNSVPSSLSQFDKVGINGWVIAFTLGVSLLTGAVFGLAPALRLSQPDLNSFLKEGAAVSAAGFRLWRRHRLQSLLVVAEIALALVLLVGTGLLVRSFWRLQQLRPGFQPEKLLTIQLQFPWYRFREHSQMISFIGRMTEYLEGLPGVQSVSAASSLPLIGKENLRGFSVENEKELNITPDLYSKPTEVDFPPDPFHDPGKPKLYLWARIVYVSPRYFQTMRIPVKQGREFDKFDSGQSMPVAVINETMARRYWLGKDPMGKGILGWRRPEAAYIKGKRVELAPLRPGEKYLGERPWVKIVGIVGDSMQHALESKTLPTIYRPLLQSTRRKTDEPESAAILHESDYMGLVVRTTGRPEDLINVAQKQVWNLDPEQPALRVAAMEDVLTKAVELPRFNMLLFGVFAGVALLLAAVGIYGLMAYMVIQRTHEIGIRIALGARKNDVLRLVMSHGVKLAAMGIVIGLAAALALTRLIKSWLVGVSATDPLTFAGIVVLLTAVALLACYLPARRATKVDPLIALRSE
jgi:putative ABC transport system permease protein